MRENFLHQAAKVSAELFHSNMLAFLWKAYPNLARKHLCGVLSDGGVVQPLDVFREKYNIDILVVANDYVIGLENKFKSRHSVKQLTDYKKKLESAYPSLKQTIVALCTTENDARDTESRIGNDIAKFISYKCNVLPFLKAVIQQAEKDDDKRALFYVNDYAELIDHLLKLVEEHEGAIGTLGEALTKISKDQEIDSFRMGPLIQRRLFERILVKLSILIDGNEQCHSIVLDDIAISSRSKLGTITATMQSPVEHAAFNIQLGIQLEGAQLRRFVIVEKMDRSPMTPKNKLAVHTLATTYARKYRAFGDAADETAPSLKAKHFKVVDGLDSFLAYSISKSAFFLYRVVNDGCGSLTFDEVANRLKVELDCLVECHGAMSTPI